MKTFDLSILFLFKGIVEITLFFTNVYDTLLN